MAADVVTLGQLAKQLATDEAQLAQGGGAKAIERQRAKGRLFVRDRLKLLLDEGAPWLELGLWAGWQMYDEWGGAPVLASSAALARSKAAGTW